MIMKDRVEAFMGALLRNVPLGVILKALQERERQFGLYGDCAGALADALVGDWMPDTGKVRTHDQVQGREL